MIVGVVGTQKPGVFISHFRTNTYPLSSVQIVTCYTEGVIIIKSDVTKLDESNAAVAGRKWIIMKFYYVIHAFQQYNQLYTVRLYQSHIDRVKRPKTGELCKNSKSCKNGSMKWPSDSPA